MDQEKNITTPEQSVLFGALAYVGPLVVVSYIMAKDVASVKFHIKQGLVLFVIEVGLWFLGGMLWMLYPIMMIINLALLVLAVMGIMNAINKKETPLPLVGSFAKYFNF